MERVTTVIRSKVAHRIVLLFVLCALLPVIILASLSYYEVSSQLRDDSEKRLSQASKNQGMAILQRLQILESELDVLSLRIDQNERTSASQISPEYFKGFSVFGTDGAERSHWGTMQSFPALTSGEKKHLLSGRTLLKVGNCADLQNCILLMRTTSGVGSSSFLSVGEVSPEFLWAGNTMPLDLQFCVLSATRILLFCSDDRMCPSPAPLPTFNHASGSYQWRKGADVYDAAYWKLLIGPAFLEQPWTIVVSEEHADAVFRVQRFRSEFPLVILLCLWVVLLMSLVQVRRTLGPLQKLREGTQKIGAGKFESRVEVQSGDEFEQLACAFNSMAAQLGQQFHTLTAVKEIDQAIFASLDREAIVDGALARMQNLVPCDAFGVSIFDHDASVAWTRFRRADADDIYTETQPLTASDFLQLQNCGPAYRVLKATNHPAFLSPLVNAHMQSFLVLPIQFDGSVQAALVCASKNAGVPARDEVQPARQVADQLAVAFSHVRLINALEQLHWESLTALARAIDAKSQWTAGHSERVAALSVEIARNMGLSSKDLKVIQMGSLLHDIGKIGTPRDVLDKPGKLTDEEMRVMRDHVRTGVRILEPIAAFREALPIVAQHHEWLNGQGYPEGATGADISLYARIVAVADCYDALTSDRPYRSGLPREQAVQLLRQRSNVQFDPAVIETFSQMMSKNALAQGGLATPAVASAPQLAMRVGD